MNPEFVVADEPISALDVSIRAQVINLLNKLKRERGLTYLFIAHDLSVVRFISDRIAVINKGRIVELAECEELFANPLHPYTKALFSAIPIPSKDAKKHQTELLTGEVSSPIEPKPGCRFAPRCKFACGKCTERNVPFEEIEPGHFVSCVLFEK